MSVETETISAVAPASPQPVAARPRRRSSRGDIALLIGIGVVLTVLQMLRQPGLQSWNTMWQEDGGVFLTDALDDPFLETLFSPYNAYLHVIARLIAGYTSLFPLEDAALIITLSSAVVTTLIAFYVYFASRRVFRTQWASLLAALSVVLLPAAGYETNANIANLHWYLIYAQFWVLLAPPRNAREVALSATITALAVLSDPLTGILLPLVALMVHRHRSRGTLVVAGVYGLTMGVQLLLRVLDDPVARYASSSFADLPGVYALRVTGSFLVGDLFLDDFWKPLGPLFAFTCLALVAGFCAYGLARGEQRTRRLALWAIGLSVAYLWIPLMLRGTENFLSRDLFNLNGSRYALLPILFLTVAVLAILEDLRAFSADTRRHLQIAFTVGTAALMLTNFSIFTTRTNGPRWTDGVETARKTCARTGGLRPNAPPRPGPIPGQPLPEGDVRIPIAPNIPDPPFAVTVDCSRLR
ncbi:MAG: hypothetical protein M3P50_05685 [Actinomycetota bacterium]|nr:hypothetical protein [Actinomycetota bacterium]